jgi:transposase
MIIKEDVEMKLDLICPNCESDDIMKNVATRRYKCRDCGRQFYIWTFTMMHVPFRCGVGRGKAKAQSMVGEMFLGTEATDDYQAYESLFNEHQSYWVHLLGKAIKLMHQPSYAEFFKALYAIYKQAVCWQKDQRLSVGRTQKVADLKVRIWEICTRDDEIMPPDFIIPEQALIKLLAELVRGIEALLVFVEHPEVVRGASPLAIVANIRSDRNIHHEAEIRKGGRTSKSDTRADRRGINTTVLATLNTRFEKFTLNHLISEVTRWAEAGVSIFQVELVGMKSAHAPPLAKTILFLCHLQ